MITLDTGYSITSLGGTYGGSLAGDQHTTDAVTADCSVEASFEIELQLACMGADVGLFEPPMNVEVLIRGPNRVLPLKMQLFDADGLEIADTDLESLPVVQVLFLGANPDGNEVPEELDSTGASDDGNQFMYDGSKWSFRLGAGQFDAVGTYSITAEPGDSSYIIDPTCTAFFVID